MTARPNNRRSRRLSRWITGCAALLICASSNAEDTHQYSHLTPISIIIDDIGDHHASGERAIHLPGAITYAILPHTPFSKLLARAAHHNGKEVMIHLPMESMDGHKLGPGGLTLSMTHSEFDNTLHAAIDAVPHAIGLNNHMGSLLTRHPDQMAWLMNGIIERSLNYFIDSRTTRHTIALQVALEHQVPTRKRDVFLDDDPSPAAIEAQFQRMIRVAKKHGSAIAIGHPYDTTLSLLEHHLPRLHQYGLKLVPVSQLVHAPTPLRQYLAEPPKTSNKTSLVLNHHTLTHPPSQRLKY